MTYSTLSLTVEDRVGHVRLTRGDELNTMNRAFWQDMVDVFADIDERPEIRCVVISAEGRHFTAGLDLKDMAGLFNDHGSDVARKSDVLRRSVLELQESFNVIERCRVPVLAAVQGGCIGGGVDLITAADCRYTCAGSFLTIQEVNIGLAADVGTLQRLPHLMPQGLVRELAYTGRRFTAEEGLACGLYNHVYDSVEAMMDGVMEIAREIASKSPVAVTGTKELITYTRDHTVADSLNYVAVWNSAMLNADDVNRAIAATLQKTDPEFDDMPKTLGMVRRKGHRSSAI